MRSSTKALALTAMLLTGLAAIPTLHAQEPAPSTEQGSMMMGEDGMMGQEGMMGMMQMMTQMGEMMESCNRMMQAMMAEGGEMPAMRPDASPAEPQDN